MTKTILYTLENNPFKQETRYVSLVKSGSEFIINKLYFCNAIEIPKEEVGLCLDFSDLEENCIIDEIR